MSRTKAAPAPGRSEAEPWHVVEGKRGQQLLDRGESRKAKEVFESILKRLDDAPSYARAVILERLGRCFHMDGQPQLSLSPFREALAVLGSLAPSDGVRSLRGTLRSELGDSFRALGQYADARKAFEAALTIAEESGDVRAQAIELERLGAVASAEGQLEEAVTRHRAALALCRQLHDPAIEAGALHHLAGALRQRGEEEEAEQHYREAARIDRQHGHAAQLARHLIALADLLQSRPDRLAEARHVAEEALRIAQEVDPAGKEVWRGFGILAGVLEKEARLTGNSELRSLLSTRARDYIHLSEYAPRFLATLARLPEEPSHGRAVILERIGRSFQMAGRPDIAAASFMEALGDAKRLPPGDQDETKGLRGTLHLNLGHVLRAMARDGEARQQYESALKLAEELHDVFGQEEASAALGRVFQRPQGPADGPAAPFTLTIEDDVATDYVFDPDLLVEGRRERRLAWWTEEPKLLSDDARPVLTPGVRAWVDESGAIRFALLPSAPVVEPAPGCTVMRRTRREVGVSGHPNVVWHLLRRMDGTSSTAETQDGLPAEDRAVAARLLAALAATGVVDVSGRAIGGFLHRATKKGVLPAGGLESDEVLALATDGSYRKYPGATSIGVSQSVPERLRPFHALTRARRSSRDYGGLPLRRADLDALLHTACGLTGAMPWKGRDVKLRAYPSSGALYAVEIYPVAFRVEGLGEAVCHYRAVENTLEIVRSIDRTRFVEAMLPMEREMVASAAAMICLAGVFPRHERKYGEGGYRMLVAEAGHISQTLVLAATALGLSARPFGGVFDDLVNHELGLSGEDEQFLLSVLVGHDVRPRVHGK